jgi:predicted phosphodiesterase
LISKERAIAIALHFDEHGKEATCRKFQIPEETLNRYLRAYRKEASPDEESDLLVKVAASRQKLADINQGLRKENRESYRLYNSLEVVYSEYVTLLKSSPFATFEIPVQKDAPVERYGILQLSDLHLNELIAPSESDGNMYDFTVASKRLAKVVTETKRLFKCYGITKILVAGTGDFINSDRRLSEKLASATSQVRACLLATYLIQQVIMDLAQDFSVSVAMVVGNESRIGDEDFESADVLASSNWDYMIFQQLRILFTGKAVEFIEATNFTKQVVTLDNGFNVLLIHGNLMKGASTDKQVASIIQQYVMQGIPIHMILCGHIHSASIGDYISRSSSLCGGNAYSTNDLGCLSRASQNVYIVNPDMGYHGMKIDVQHTDGYEGYAIIEELERYNVKSALVNTRVSIETLI